MQGRPSSSAPKIVFFVCLVLGILGFAGWRICRPKVRMATLEEVRRILPPELLAEPPNDPAAAARYHKLVGLAQKVDKKSIEAISAGTVSFDKRSLIANQFWVTHMSLLSDLENSLSEGPFQFEEQEGSHQNQLDPLSAVTALVKMLDMGAQYSAHAGDFESSVRMFRVAIRLEDHLRSSHGTEIVYLVAASLDSSTTKAIVDTFDQSKVPTSVTHRLLDLFPASPAIDEDRANSIRADFQHWTLKALTNTQELAALTQVNFGGPDTRPTKEISIGTYDALETARLLGQLVTVTIANVRKPLSDFDSSGDRLVDHESVGLPTRILTYTPLETPYTWEMLRYRFSMNNSHNSIGRQFLQFGIIRDRSIVEMSDRWRAYRDLVRVFLASRVYRSEHGGKLPVSASELAPLLGGWPMDPFVGKPILYRPDKEVAYSVGSNLTDDGGQIGDLRKAPDLGILLKR